MNLLSRLSAAGPKTKVALGTLAALVLLVALFDWNWFRPALERYLTQHSHRQVQLADLHLGLDAHLQPTVRLRGVRVENAPWADTQRPFAVVGEARFTFEWTSLFDDVRVITHMVLLDADIDMERQADGLRNWRLTQPDDRGPAHIRVLSLETQRSRLRIVHKGIDLALQMASTPLAETEAPLTQRITFSGNFRGAPVEGEADAGPLLSLRSGEWFALRGQAHSGTTRLTLEGRMADLLQLTRLEADVALSGTSLAAMKRFMPKVSWPTVDIKPYRVVAKVNKNEQAWDARRLSLTLGGSDLAGELHYDVVDDRGALKATLQSQRIHLSDLPLPAAAAASSSTRVLPHSALPLSSLSAVDATLDLKVTSLQAAELPALQHLHLHTELEHGQLQLALRAADLAGGHLSGQLALDSREPDAAVRLELQANGLRLEQLWPGQARIEGPLSARVKLHGHGPSVAAWAGSASGQLSLAMQGGSLSPRLDAKLGLNLGKLLRSFFSGDQPVPLHCGTVVIDFADGTGTTRQLMLDSAQTHVEGQGSLHLRDEAWAVLLTPHPQKPALLALRSSVMAQGSLRGFKYQLVTRPAMPALLHCASLPPA